jgi:hypothetical protein
MLLVAVVTREEKRMIYKLLVNAAFLAIGYYIGKEVGLSEKTPEKTEAKGSSGQNSARHGQDNATVSKPKK